MKKPYFFKFKSLTENIFDGKISLYKGDVNL